MSTSTDLDIDVLRRRIRIIMILEACADGGLSPSNGAVVHTVAYLSDVLSPVWDLPLLDSQVLKSGTAPRFPALQRDLDRLVGEGVVGVAAASADSGRRQSGLDKNATEYSLTRLADPIVRKLRASPSQKMTFRFVREVVLALSALNPTQLVSVGAVELAYADPGVDTNGVIDLSGEYSMNSGAAAALRFRDVVPDGTDLSNTQLVHLYVRHLYRRMHVA